MEKIGPKHAMCRRVGAAVCGRPNCPTNKRPYPPGQHGRARRRLTEFHLRMLEKQKLRAIYGVGEKQFRRYFRDATRHEAVTGEELLRLLETRLDSLVLRLGLRGAVYGTLISAAGYTVILCGLCARFVLRRQGSEKATRIVIIEPVWTNYRSRVYGELAEHCEVDWIFSRSRANAGFGEVIPSSVPNLRYVEVPLVKLASGVIWQGGIVRYMLRERPDIVLVSADPQSAGLWISLLLGRILRIPVFAHGHGVSKKTRAARRRSAGSAITTRSKKTPAWARLPSTTTTTR